MMSSDRATGRTKSKAHHNTREARAAVFAVLLVGAMLFPIPPASAATALVKDIFVGASSSNPSAFANVNGTLYFRATDGGNGLELWKSDGTAAGTAIVKDINRSGARWRSNPT